jgi:hypothetical protein
MALTFDTAYYLRNNPDVLAAVANGSIPSAEWHYNNYGWKEGRNPNSVFDTFFYLATNGDVLAAGVNPLEHFEQYGAKEGRTPSEFFVTKEAFDETQYLIDNPDVAAAGVDAYQHYALFGFREGRVAFTDNGEPIIGGGGGNFVLSANIETLTGTAGGDTFYSYVQSSPLGFLVNTLQSGDVINGGAGQDTLRADIAYDFAAIGIGGGPSGGSFAPITPTLNSIETVDVRFLADNVLDLSRSTGVQTINVHDSVADAEFYGVQGASTFNVANQSNVGVAFNGGTAANITLNLANVGTGFDAEGAGVTYASRNGALTSASVNVSNSDVDVAIGDDDLETLTLNVNNSFADVDVGIFGEGTAAIDTLNLTATNSAMDEEANIYRGVGIEAGTIAAANLTLTASDVYIDASGASEDGEDPTATVTAAVTGANRLSGSYVEAITDLTVTGEGSLTVGEEGSDDGFFDGYSLSSLETLTASNAGGITAYGLGSSAESVTTGAGADDITFSGDVAGGASVNLGAGDDVLTLESGILVGTTDDADAVATLAGGAGNDTLILNSGAAGDVTAENVDISGFEVLEISNTLVDAIDASAFDVNQVVLAAGYGAAASISGLDTGATVTLEDGVTGDATLAIAIEGADEATNDVLNLNLSAAADEDFGTIVANDIETINIVATDTDLEEGGEAEGFTVALSADSVENIVVSGNGAVALNSEEGAYLSNTVESIDASALEGDFQVGIATGGTAGVTILGGQGDNIIRGGSANDTITTYAGDDVIIGGLGADQLNAGGGSNTFVYRTSLESSGLNIDTITGFQAGATAAATHDVFDLRALLTGQVQIGTDGDLPIFLNLTAVDFLGNVAGIAAANTALTNSTENNLEIVFDTVNDQLYADVNADGTVNSGDLVISLTGVNGLNDWNFVGLAS